MSDDRLQQTSHWLHVVRSRLTRCRKRLAASPTSTDMQAAYAAAAADVVSVQRIHADTGARLRGDPRLSPGRDWSAATPGNP